ncbi:MAG: hypothetical protein EXR75_01700 [Myxococcales bacterium]|nr:hypothetical protein [Myxococcales bacterium]
MRVDRVPLVVVVGASLAVPAVLLWPRFIEPWVPSGGEPGQASAAAADAPRLPLSAAASGADRSDNSAASGDAAGAATSRADASGVAANRVVASDAAASGVAASDAEGAAGAARMPGARCGEGMLFVDGNYCPAVAHRCAEFVGDRGAERESARFRHEDRRCKSFDNERFCEGRPARLRFCIDRFEYPNLERVAPAVMLSFEDAVRACAVEGKRLCSSEEWAFACEGAATLPYATGLVRDPTACNIDRPARGSTGIARGDHGDIAATVARLDQRLRSGSMVRCISPFGVADMTGNVAEWVVHRPGRKGAVPSDVALAGGDWERTGATCRSLDATHGRGHRAHVGGARCCATALGGGPARVLLPSGTRLERRRPVLPHGDAASAR